MSRKATALLYAAVSLAITAVSGSAQAACPIAGKWFATQFASNNGGGTFSATCTWTIRANGNYSGPCLTTSIGASPATGTSTGIIKSNAQCRVSGVIKGVGFGDTTIDGGIVTNDGTQIVFTGHRKNPADQVRIVILNKID
jgi:hypothetical protein